MFIVLVRDSNYVGMVQEWDSIYSFTVWHRDLPPQLGQQLEQDFGAQLEALSGLKRRIELLYSVGDTILTKPSVGDTTLTKPSVGDTILTKPNTQCCTL